MIKAESVVYCEEGSHDADVAYCEKHLDEIKQAAFDDGKAEGFEEGKNSFDPKD